MIGTKYPETDEKDQSPAIVAACSAVVQDRVGAFDPIALPIIDNGAAVHVFPGVSGCHPVNDKQCVPKVVKVYLVVKSFQLWIVGSYNAVLERNERVIGVAKLRDLSENGDSKNGINK